jgi:hypothetical protein
VLAAVAVLPLWPAPALLVRHDGTGRLLWRVPVREGSRVELSYINSLYNAPTAEHFVVERGRLRLVEVTTTAEAVFEYLRLPPPYERRGDRLVAKTDGPALASLTTRIGATGQQRLTVDGRDFPLYRIGTGEAARVTVDRAARISLLLGSGAP